MAYGDALIRRNRQSRAPTLLPLAKSCSPVQPFWRVPNHFVVCSNFEQSLPKMVTNEKRWSTTASSGWPQGRSLVVQVSGGALTRTSSVNPSIKIKSNFRENRVDTILRAGLPALLFFCFSQGFAPARFCFSQGLTPALFYFHISARSPPALGSAPQFTVAV